MKKAELQEVLSELLDFFNDYIYHQFEISAEGIPANADACGINDHDPVC